MQEGEYVVATKDFGEFIRLELSAIRDEYLSVKKCQYTFFIFEITATGVVLSFLLPMLLANPQGQTLFHLFLVFSPAVVIIPSLYIILDKGITLNRIAAFFMVIEQTLTKQQKWPKNLIGWEQGCLEFRERASELVTQTQSPEAGTQGPNKFYKLVYWISAILNGICAILFLALYLRLDFKKPENLADKAGQIILFIIAILILLAFLNHLYQTWKRITQREYTIASMAALWQKILE